MSIVCEKNCFNLTIDCLNINIIVQTKALKINYLIFTSEK